MKTVFVYDLEDFKERFRDAHDWALERDEETEVRILRSDNREWNVLKGVRYALDGSDAIEAKSFELIWFTPHLKRYYLAPGLGALGIDIAGEEWAFLDEGFENTDREIGRGEYHSSVTIN